MPRAGGASLDEGGCFCRHDCTWPGVPVPGDIREDTTDLALNKLGVKQHVDRGKWEVCGGIRDRYQDLEMNRIPRVVCH